MVVYFLQCFELDEETLETREVVAIDIAYDELPEKHYVPEEVSHMHTSDRSLTLNTLLRVQSFKK